MTSSLDLFADLILSRIDALTEARGALLDMGALEVDRQISIDAEGAYTHRVLFHRSGDACAFSFLETAAGGLTDGALIVPASATNEATLLDFVLAQPNLTETTEETRAFLDFAPEDVREALVASRFWTSKTPGQTGVNLALGPALFDAPGGGRGVALTAGRNLALQDGLTDDDLARLTGPGSRLAKFVTVFSELALKVCGDPATLRAQAQAYGYASDDPADATSFILGGGHGPRPRSEDITSAIHVNDRTKSRFEFALTFILDERLTPDTIRSALFEALGIEAAPRSDGSAWIEIGGRSYVAEHRVMSAVFGNHAFVLHR